MIKFVGTRVVEGANIYKCFIQFITPDGEHKFITTTAGERPKTEDVLKGYNYILPIYRSDFVHIGKDRIEVSIN